MQDPLEIKLLEAFRRNPLASKKMIVGTAITSAEMFHEELRQALANIPKNADELPTISFPN